MYRAYLLQPPKQHIADRLQKELDQKHKRAKSQVKSTVDCSAPKKYTHMSRFTGGGAQQSREKQKDIDKMNLKIFNSMRKTFDNKGGYCQENLRHFELPPNRISTKSIDEKEQRALSETYVRKIRTSMAVPTSDALQAYENATGDRFSYDLALKSVPEIGQIRSKKAPNPNIKPVYQAASQVKDFKQSQIYAAGKITKPAVLPEIVKVIGGYGGVEKRNIDEIEYFEAGNEDDKDEFDIFVDKPEVDIQEGYVEQPQYEENNDGFDDIIVKQPQNDTEDAFDIREEMNIEEHSEGRQVDKLLSGGKDNSFE